MSVYHKLKGSVNYTVVGNPTIVDGVASGFSNEADTFAALQVSNFDSSQSYHWHIRFQYQAPTNCLIMGNIAKYARPSFLLRTVGLRVSTASGVQLDISNTWIAGNWYEADLEFDGTSEYTLSLSSNNTLIGKTSVSYSTPLSFTTVGIGAVRAGDGVTFNGSIDLNKTYITVNGQPWFGVCPVEVKKHQLMGPVGYTVVGSPTIVDGVASGFSSSGYVQLTAENHPTIAGAKYELFIKFTTPATVARNGICGSSYSYAQGGVWIDGAKKLVSNVTTNVATRNLYFSSSALTGSTTYYAHLILDSINNDYRALLSTDNTNWTTTYLTLEEGETISSQAVTSVFRFGYNGSSAGGQFDGSIDLNETYIKVNGKLWYWQPQETKKIVVNNTVVWEKTV